jgi:predicted Fe-Mo cluster-binding NifX family protein
MEIVQIITLLMGLSGFSVGTNPNAPNADQALQYAVPDADIVVHFDAGAVIPNNYKVLTNLPNQPAIKASPELSKMVRKAIAEIDGPKGMALSMTGIDLTKDISDATAFIQFVPNQDPNMLVAVHGKFSTGNIDKIAKLVGKGSVKAGGGAWVDTGDGNAVALTKNGVLLAGTTSLVKDRMTDTWKSPAVSSMQNVADVINTKPVFAVSVQLSKTARDEINRKADKDQNFVVDLVKRHKFASFGVYKDGIGWTWVDSSKAGLESMQQVSDGTVDLLRAAQIAPRGFAKIVMGALESYKGTNKQIDDVIKRKADLWKIVETYTGDGQFKAAVTADPKTFKLGVRLTGKSLSEVVPLGGMLPGIGAWLLLAKGSAQTPPPVMMPSPTPLPPPPAKKGNPSPGKRP